MVNVRKYTSPMDAMGFVWVLVVRLSKMNKSSFFANTHAHKPLDVPNCWENGNGKMIMKENLCGHTHTQVRQLNGCFQCPNKIIDIYTVIRRAPTHFLQSTRHCFIRSLSINSIFHQKPSPSPCMNFPMQTTLPAWSTVFLGISEDSLDS